MRFKLSNSTYLAISDAQKHIHIQYYIILIIRKINLVSFLLPWLYNSCSFSWHDWGSSKDSTSILWGNFTSLIQIKMFQSNTYHKSVPLVFFTCEGRWTLKIQSSSLQRWRFTPGGIGKALRASRFGRCLPMAAQHRYCSEKDKDELRCNLIFVLAAVDDTTGYSGFPLSPLAATPSGSLSLKKESFPCHVSKWTPITEPWSNLEENFWAFPLW